jgi:hypothetical protein
VLVADLFQSRGDRIERLVPGNALKRFVFAAARERPFRDSGLSLERMEKPVRRVDAVQVFGNFAAQKSLGNRLRGIALHLSGPSRVVDRNQ